MESMMVFGVTPEITNKTLEFQPTINRGTQTITVGIMRLGPGVDGVNIGVGVDEHGENGEHFSASIKWL